MVAALRLALTVVLVNTAPALWVVALAASASVAPEVAVSVAQEAGPANAAQGDVGSVAHRAPA